MRRILIFIENSIELILHILYNISGKGRLDMGIKLDKKIGDFLSKVEIDSSYILQKRKEFESEINFKEFLEDVEEGRTWFDELMLVIYDYRNGGIGSVYVYLNVYREDYVERETIEKQYAIATEYSGDVQIIEYVPLGEEEKLLSNLKQIILKATNQFTVERNEV